MSDEKGTLTARLTIIAYAAAIVAIAGHQIHVRYAPKKLAKSPATKEQLLNEFRGDLDVAKASVSKEYLDKYSRKPNENEAKQPNPAGSDSNGSKVDTQGLKNLLNKLAP